MSLLSLSAFMTRKVDFNIRLLLTGCSCSASHDATLLVLSRLATYVKSISICTIPDRKTLTDHFCGTALVFFCFLFFSWNILLLCFQKCDAQLWFCFG